MLIKPPHGTVVGSVIGSQPSSRLMLRPENTQITSNQSAKITPKTRPREVDMPRAVNYYADFSGCGFWRMLWPEHTLNAYQKYYQAIHYYTMRPIPYYQQNNKRLTNKSDQ